MLCVRINITRILSEQQKCNKNEKYISKRKINIYEDDMYEVPVSQTKTIKITTKKSCPGEVQSTLYYLAFLKFSVAQPSRYGMRKREKI